MTTARPDGTSASPGRSTLKGILRRTGLLGIARHARDRLRAVRVWRRNARFSGTPAGRDGLPMPPAHLIILVTGSADLEWYVESGRRAAESLGAMLVRNAVDPERLRSILDFGCGCGRVSRHWRHTPAAVFGSDLNERLVAWCRRNLRFARFEANGLAPPLPFETAQFDFVYALSVFTHLPEPLQAPWIAELARVTAPGGHLAVSVHGARYRSVLTADEQARFDAGQLVVRNGEASGANLCGAFHPRSYLEQRLVAGVFDVVDFVAEGAAGNPHQDLYLLRKR